MDLNQIRIFLAVLETSSVTRAAEQVGLSPGAVSQQLRSLSTELGTDLFVRAGKRIVPTSSALRLSGHARSIQHQVSLIRQEFDSGATGDSRPFSFAAGATSLIYRLSKPLRTIRKRYPQTEIHVTVAATEEIVEGLQSRRFDLGVISMPVNEERLTILPLYEEELLGLRPSHAAHRAKIVNLEPEELAAHPFLLYPKRSNMRSVIDSFFRSLGINPRVMMEADDTEAIKRLVESGFGYSILPEYALRRQSRLFQVFRISGHRLVRNQALAMAKSEYPRPLTETIASLIQSALAGPMKAGRGLGSG